MTRAYKIFKSIFRAVLLAVAGVLCLYNVYVIAARTFFGNGMPKVFGYAGASVVSGSMEEAIGIGDFIIIKEQEDYFVGDVITFYDAGSGTYITHRVILVSGETFATKGDANGAPDSFSVPKAAVAGKVVAVWRGFGKAVAFMQSPLGLVSVIGGSVVLWILADIGAEVFRKRDE